MPKITLEQLAARLERRGVDHHQLQNIVESARHQSAARGGNVIDLSKHLKGNTLTIGVLSDTQLNSKYCDIALLKDLYERFAEANVAYVLHTGDITDGHSLHDTHFSEVHYLKPEDALKLVAKEYPNIGVPTYFIGGNDDKTYRTRARFDMLNSIDDAREDLVYLGPNEVDVRVAPKTLARMIHPPKRGRPYTVSYHLQQHIDSIEGGDKPDILLLGSYHHLYEQYRRGIHAFLTGTLQHQTPYWRQKNRAANIGGWILNLTLDDKGALTDLTSTVVPLVRKK